MQLILEIKTMAVYSCWCTETQHKNTLTLSYDTLLLLQVYKPAPLVTTSGAGLYTCSSSSVSYERVNVFICDNGVAR